MMDYYKIIAGRKYDRQLLETADLYTTGVGDGRFSQNDAQEIYQEAYDRGRISDIERQTLFYILDNYNFTDKAEQWLRTRLGNPGLAYSSLESRVAAILDRFELSTLAVKFPEQEVNKQEELFSARLSFISALEQALTSFLNDAKHPESPRAIVIESHALFADQFDSQALLKEAIQKKMLAYLQKGKMALIPYEKVINYDEIDYNPPEDGEKLKENWVFSLMLPSLSDHIFWAIIDRNATKEPYNYGFN